MIIIFERDKMKLKFKQPKSRNIEYYYNKIVSHKPCRNTGKHTDNYAKFQIAEYFAEKIKIQAA